MRHEVHDGRLTIWLEGRLDANNASDVEREIGQLASQAKALPIQLDATDLTYIASAGLRVIMRLLKSGAEVSVVNASPETYNVFEMTGIAEIMDVRRQLREVSIDGLRQIGAGAFGRVYRLDDERVIKVYAPSVNPLEKIERERSSARQAFVHDIPSAIPFDVVRVGEEHGIIYELIEARTLGEAIVASPERLEQYALDMAGLLRKLHSTHFEQGQLPDARLIFHGWVDVAENSGLYQRDTIALLRQMVDGIDDADTFVHGDFHPANIMVMPDGELMLIDMGDASVGNPVIDLAGTYHVLRIAARRPGGAMRLTGMPDEMLDRLWEVFVRAYFGVESDQEVQAIERRLAFCALPRTMGSTARSKLITDEVRRKQATELERRLLQGPDA